ncbi:hypothetical protein FO519_003370 [Halicephalobus sp. NKZ332]|nr:hypothetical protein FO519_003370 [Halicephalobus sp. NKZ332]
MCCCCFNLHRHQVHLISYGCVAFGLIATGLIFTVFSIFYKDSQIGKVWLAGPTTMVVGLVLCGKVVIDWGPAMLHAREGSIDSTLIEQTANPVLSGHEGDVPLSYPMMKNQPEQRNHRPTPNGECPRHPRLHTYDGDVGQEGAIDCIIYSQYDSASNSNVSLERVPNSLPLKHLPYRMENDHSPQSPIASLRARIGFLKGETVGTQTSPPPHTPCEKTSSGMPVIKPRLVSPQSSPPPSLMLPTSSHLPTMNNFSQQRVVNSSSPLLQNQEQTVFPAHRNHLDQDLECNCGGSGSGTNLQNQRRSQPQIQDYGSMQREPHGLSEDLGCARW